MISNYTTYSQKTEIRAVRSLSLYKYVGQNTHETFYLINYYNYGTYQLSRMRKANIG